jgi:magnesium transporter
MTIIAARRYIAGQAAPTPLAIDGQQRSPPGPGGFDWIGLAAPTAEEMERVGRQFGLHPLAVEDALNPNHPPKLEPYAGQLFVVARTAALGVGEAITYGQTAMFLGCDFLITVRQGSTRAHLELRRQLEANPERLCEGPDFVLHGVLDFVVDGYQPLIDGLESAAQEIEEAAIETFPDPVTIRRIFRLRRQLRRFERTVGPMVEVCERLALTELPAVDPSARVWFRDVLDHVRRTLARVGALRETLANVVETASLLEQHRQGTMTRSLAAWAAILAVPTAIAGIYGMNFKFMPELEWRYGYFVVLGTIVAVCLALWLRFRRIGWL